MWKVAFLLVILVFVTSGQLPPLMSRPSGFEYAKGARDAKVRVDMYIDMICPDSQRAWPNVMSMAKHYGPDNVRLIVHQFPLPYHRNAFYASRATYVVHSMSEGRHTFDWMNKIFTEKRPLLTNSVFHNSTDEALVIQLGDYAAELGLNRQEFIDYTRRTSYDSYEKHSRHSWKHACLKGVSGTPTFFINDVIRYDILSTWELTDWTAFMDPLLMPTKFDNFTAAVNLSSCDTSTASAATPATWLLPLLFSLLTLR